MERKSKKIYKLEIYFTNNNATVIYEGKEEVIDSIIKDIESHIKTNEFFDVCSNNKDVRLQKVNPSHIVKYTKTELYYPLTSNKLPF